MKGRSVVVRPSIEAYHAARCPAARKPAGKCARKACSYRAKHKGAWSPRFPTMDEAKEWKRSQVTESEAKRGPTPSVTLSDAWEAWHAKAKAGAIHSRSRAPYKPVTLRDYREAMEKRVLPDYGANMLSDVTAHGLKLLIADLRESGLSASAIRNTMNPIRALYRDADEAIDGWRGPNPTLGLRLPKVTSRREPERIPSPEQSAALVRHAPERDRPIWATSCYAGLRRGELRALRRQDIDLPAGKIRVRRSWDRVEHEIAPKSDAGKRDVPIFAALRPHLERHLAKLLDQSPDALVFATKTGGPFDGGDVSKRADKAWDGKAQRFGLHECRHGFASVCVEAGVNPKRIQVWMGHSSITTTFDLYGRLLEGSEAEWVGKVDAYLARGTAVGPSGAESSGMERQRPGEANGGPATAPVPELAV